MDSEAMALQRKTMEAVWAVVPDGKVSDKLRAVANAMFITCKNGELGPDDILNHLALLTGVATGVMLEAADLLEEE